MANAPKTLSRLTRQMSLVSPAIDDHAWSEDDFQTVHVALQPPPQSLHLDLEREPETAPTSTSTEAWLQVAALGLFGAAATHYAVMPTHFRESWSYGLFFLCAASAQVAMAFALLRSPSRRLLLAAVAGSLAVIALWVVSRFWGVPVGPDNGATEAIGVLDVTATVLEGLTAVGCFVVWRQDVVRPAWRWSLWSLPVRLLLLVLAVGLPITAWFSPRG